MKLFAFVALTVFLASCSKLPAKQPIVATAQTPGSLVMKPLDKLTMEEVYAELWKKCAAKHLKYVVFCYGDCLAEAWDNQVVWIYKQKYYQADSQLSEGPTEAARRLIPLLDGEPNKNDGPQMPSFETHEVNPK